VSWGLCKKVDAESVDLGDERVESWADSVHGRGETINTVWSWEERELLENGGEGRPVNEPFVSAAGEP